MKRSCLILFIFLTSCGKTPDVQRGIASEELSHEFSLCGIIAFAQNVQSGVTVVMNAGVNAFIVLEGQKRINLEISKAAPPELHSTIKSLSIPAEGCVYGNQDVKAGYEGDYFLVEAIDLN